MNINEIVLISYLFLIFIYVFYLIYTKAFSMNAEPLTHQPLFKAAIIMPIMSFFSIGFICWSGHKLQIDADGFNNFLNISKLPLALLSLAIPFGVIVNNIHRTIQTDKQIKEAEKKNKVDFFYAHRKNTIEIFQNLESLPLPIPEGMFHLEVDNCYTLYKKCYPYASTSSTNYQTSPLFTQKAIIIWIELAALFDIEEPKSRLDLIRHILKIEQCFEILHTHYGLKPIKIEKLYQYACLGEDGNDHYYQLTTKISSGYDLKLYIQSYWNIHLSIIEAIGETISGETMKLIIKMLMYSTNPEVKYSSFHCTSLIEQTVPRIVKV